MQGRDNRHAQLTQESENVTAHSSTVDPVFVLQTDEIDIIDIQKVGSAAIRFYVLLHEFKSDAVWIRIALHNVVNGQRDTCCLTKLRSDSFTQIGGEGSDAAPARQIITNKCNSVDH